MSMGFYENYLNNIKLAPKEDYKAMQQAFVDSVWEDTTLLENVKEEIKHGGFKFKEIEVWKNSISEFTTNIAKDEKDYRRLMFKNQNHIVERGRFYYFENNYWIVYDPTSDIEPYAEVYVRRCNNYLKWIDRTTGEIYSVPCVLDSEVSSPAPRYSKTMVLPNGHIVAWVQCNETTKKIKRNQRFIFNGDPYKFTGYNAYMQMSATTDDVPMLYLDLYLDEVQPTDDINNNIANRYEIDYKVKITQNNIQQIKGHKGELKAFVTLNGDIVDKEVRWYSLNNNVLIDEYGNYEVIGEVGQKGILRAFMLDNENIYDETYISIEQQVSDKKEIIVEPLHEEINQGEIIQFNANVYIDDSKQSDKVFASIQNLDPSYYEFESKDNNEFILTSKKISNIPLIIDFISGDITKTIQIKLKSLF